MIVTITLNPSIDKYAEIESFQYDDVIRLHSVHQEAGGKGVNVSRLVRRCGNDTLALGFIGGHSGGDFLNLLEEEEIPQEFTVIAGETRSNLAVFDKKESKIIKLNEPGPEVKEGDFQNFILTLRKYVEKENIFVISGTLPEGIGAEMYQKIIDILKGRVKAILLDTESSILKETLTENKIDYIKPNIYETERLTGQRPESDGNFRKAIWKLKDFAAFPIISAGEKGVFFEDENKKLYNIYAPPVVSTPTVGAGDAFVAGFCAALSLDKPLLEAIRQGVSFSAATAISGKLCQPEEAQSMLSKIKTREI
jgi:1-phosphofructokinase family hexose kinase